MTPSQEFLVQHAALTTQAGVAELPRTLIAVAGDDRTSFLQSFLTSDVKRLIPGTGCEAFVTSSQGKTLGHVLVFCHADHYLLDTTAAQAAPLIAHFERYVISEDVQFVDRSAGFAVLLLAGPAAGSLLRRMADADPPSERLAHKPMSLAGHQPVVRRLDYAGPESFFLQAEVSSAAEVRAALVQFGAIACEEPAAQAARLEAGFPLFGLDIGPENLPQEVNRDQLAISFTKGCYLGQETVARIDAVGHVNRLLVGLKLSGAELPASGTALSLGGQIVGQLTSATWSPRLGGPLAMGYVRRAQAKPGTVLSMPAGTAEVVSLPVA